MVIFNQNTKIFIHKNASYNMVCEIAAILSRDRQVNTNTYNVSASRNERKFSISELILPKYCDPMFVQFVIWFDGFSANGTQQDLKLNMLKELIITVKHLVYW